MEVAAVQLAARFVLGARASLLAALAGLFATLWFLVPWSTGSDTSTDQHSRILTHLVCLGFVKSENWILHATVVGWRVSNSIGLSMPRGAVAALAVMEDLQGHCCVW